MNIPIDILIFIFSILLGVIGYFLNRILSRLTLYEDKLHEIDKDVALNKNAIECLRRVA